MDAYENLFACYPFVFRDLPKNCVQGSNPQRCMIGDGDTLGCGYFGLKNDVATDLVNNAVSPIFT